MTRSAKSGLNKKIGALDWCTAQSTMLQPTLEDHTKWLRKPRNIRLKRKQQRKQQKKWPRGSRQRMGILLETPRFLRRGHDAPRPPRREAPHRREDIRATIMGTAVRARRIKMSVATHAGADLSSSSTAALGHKRPQPAPIGYSGSKPLLSFTNRSTPAWQIICLRTLCQLICFFYRRFILMFDFSFTNRLA
jgi:hypothetical protein